ncbi:MAG: TIGR02221 family CRISPR-associated protein, partial [Synergistaceae bacterium]|nr:TIGR02221 family CRISPR-associated protein [Synergistaceae bacterium]
MEKNRSVFLSFLGIGGPKGYIPCVYEYKKNDSEQPERSNKVALIQHALAEIFDSEWTDAYIFTTEAANTHWDRLIKGWPKSSTVTPQNVDIPDGKNEEEMWNIFEKIFKKLKPNDEVYFDITHGFRSLPFLAGSLLQYAKSLKSVTVKGIFYGAFKSADEIAPIINLSTFSQILDWSDAAYDFIKNGNSGRLSELTKNDVTPITGETRKEIEDLIGKVDKLCLDLKTVRGRNIIRGIEAEDISKM